MVYINRYYSYSDRGATVHYDPYEIREVDEQEIHVDGKLPHWPGWEKPVVRKFVPHEVLELEYMEKHFTLHPGEEELIGTSHLSEDHGVVCRSYECVKLVEN